MNTKLYLFLLIVYWAISCVELGSAGKSKFPSFMSKSLEVNQIDRKLPEGPFCNSIVAYYAGTLQNKNSPSQQYNVQFQLRLWANELDKKIHVKTEHWNEDFSDSGDFELDFYYDTYHESCNIHDKNCALSFAKKTTNFTLDLNTNTENYFHLLNFNYFNNSFGLYDSRDKCTKHQLDNLDDDYTPNSLHEKFTYCLCCDDYSPNELLGCPANNFKKGTNYNATTKAHKPIKTTTKKVEQPTNMSSNPLVLTCQKLVGYYVGTFENPRNRSVSLKAQFQFEIDANVANKKVYYGITHLNKSFADYGNKELMFGFSDYTWNTPHICHAAGELCSIKFVKHETYKVVNFGFAGSSPWPGILQFPSFNNSFNLNNTIDGCTYYQQYDISTPRAYKPDYTLFSYCICCDKYKPHPILRCPPNPWQE